MRRNQVFDRIQSLSKEDIEKIHDGSMEILLKVGVQFEDENTLGVFKSHGFKIDGKKVFFTEKNILNAIEASPPEFTINARDPDKNITVGLNNPVFAPGYGAPFITEIDGSRRNARMEDYNRLCKIVHTSKYLDCNGFMMVEPSDVSAKIVHLDMLYSSITLSDRVFMGCPTSPECADDSIKMAEIIYGDIRSKPVMISLINSLSPLKYSREMSGALMRFAEYGQPCIIAPLIMGGASGPIKIAGILTLQNAEILAGITLAQLIRRGTPVVYGSASSITDMRSGRLSVGAPEHLQIISATSQIARYYNIPSRAGGAVTDAHIPDMQAGMESALSLYTAAHNGISFILHSAGILTSYLSMSFEKFLIDEALCGKIKKILNPIEINEESLSIDIIKEVGIGGEFLSHPKTFELCRSEYHSSNIMFADSFEGWSAKGRKRLEEFVHETLKERLSMYEKPPIDEGVENELKGFIERRKKDYLDNIS